MNRHPPRPPQPLDAEERALAKALPRLHGQTAPGPDLDADILAAARAALQPPRASRVHARPRIRWIAPASLAASLLLAVGLAWRLRPLPVPVPVAGSAQSEVQADNTTADDLPAMRMISPPAAPQPAPMVQAPSPEQAKPSELPERAPARQQAMAPANLPQATTREFVPAPLPLPVPAAAPPAPPAPPPPAVASGVIPAESQSSERAANVDMAEPASGKTLDAYARDASPVIAGKARMSEGARRAKVETARQQLAIPEAANEAEMAADAGFVDDPDDSVPPATADSPAVRDAWLQRIRQLLDQGNVEDAKASLAEFRHRYPDAALPAALQALEIGP